MTRREELASLGCAGSQPGVSASVVEPDCDPMALFSG